MSRTGRHRPWRENRRRQNFLWRQKHRNRLRQKAQKQRWRAACDRDGDRNFVNDREQEIQETPEKTEAEKPSEPPALSEGTATDQPDTPPSYEEEKQEEPAPAENQTPKTGDTKDGMVYVEGFGWITDEGEGSGIYADDMYENGNKIGIMD